MYYPDYVIVLDGLPAMIVEAKTPSDENVEEAFREARLYATELNALYSPRVNPCGYVIATNGKRLLAGKWDSQNALVDLSLENKTVTSQDFITLLEIAGRDKLSKEIFQIRTALKRDRSNMTSLESMVLDGCKYPSNLDWVSGLSSLNNCRSFDF